MSNKSKVDVLNELYAMLDFEIKEHYAGRRKGYDDMMVGMLYTQSRIQELVNKYND